MRPTSASLRSLCTGLRLASRQKAFDFYLYFRTSILQPVISVHPNHTAGRCEGCDVRRHWASGGKPQSLPRELLYGQYVAKSFFLTFCKLAHDFTKRQKTLLLTRECECKSGNRVWANTPTRVRIPLSPPRTEKPWNSRFYWVSKAFSFFDFVEAFGVLPLIVPLIGF